MIKLPNGHPFQFCCAAGALGFNGDGWPWEQPLRWLGILRPQEFTIITKTLTSAPRAGNLRWWCPWRCVHLFRTPGGPQHSKWGAGSAWAAVNAVDLTNPGLYPWMRKHYPISQRRHYHLILSLLAESARDAHNMARDTNALKIKALEINLSCPNLRPHQPLPDPVSILQHFRQESRHPLIAKLAFHQLDLIPQLEEFADAFDLINTTRWSELYPFLPSPLAPYNLEGGVSGPPLAHQARLALLIARKHTSKPIISGGGITSFHECKQRHVLGANAFSIGTLFLTHPWKPNQLVQQWNQQTATVKDFTSP
jgi:dihydroorotate dehydrogenase